MTVCGLSLVAFRHRFVAFLWLMTVSISMTGVRADDQAKIEFYKARIEPLLKKNCFECHSHVSGESSGQLMLDSSVAMAAGGTRGAAVRPGRPDDSWLIKAISYSDADLQMPPSGKLPDDAIADLRQWIADGAHGAPSGGNTASSAIRRLAPEDAHNHWAYVPPVRPTLSAPDALVELARSKEIDPAVVQRFARTRIDALLLAEQLKAGLVPSAMADRDTLMRRLAYDLTGLPPDVELAKRFRSDPRSDDEAFADLIDRMLATVRFGERFARHWMDVARYADTKGYVFREEREYQQAFKYRDWLITAFNSDMPYSDFVRNQLAADKNNNSVEQNLPALGFLTLGRRFLNNKNDINDDRLDVTMRGLMGLTVACARCHDHKYDPVSQADYYALAGVFLNTEEPGGDPWPHRMEDSKEDRKSFILIRGSPGNRGAEVPRRFVSFLSPEQNEFASGSGRDQLADRITATDNPLTARVLVNRIWMRLIGSSMVDSPSDFGARCPAPRLQPILDELAVDLMESGWSIKALIRTIVSSSLYQQRSVAHASGAAIDPENALLWHMNRRRLDFESLRDSVLSVAGQLDPTVGGPSEKIHERPFSRKRTVYAFLDRQNLPGVFRNFDVASPDSHSPQRLQTTVPQQGLYLLNSAFVTEMAHTLGQQAQQHPATNDQQRIAALFQRVLQRSPDPQELAAASQFLSSVTGTAEPLPQRWFCGYGELNLEEGRLISFTELPFMNGTAWQGGSKLPDAKLGWCMLSKDGGHPGRGLTMAVSRRWVAPRDGVVAVRGKLHHRADMGDGVRGTLISSRLGKLGQWESKQQEVRTVVAETEVRAGDTLDLVTDSMGDEAHDSFEWKVRIQYQAGGETYDSSREFPAAREVPLSPWDQLAQALLAANEYAFVD